MTGDGPAPVRVPLSDGGYDVLVGRGLLPQLGALCARAGLKSPRVHLFEDAGVPAELRDAAAASFSGARVSRSLLDLNESTKSFATLERTLVDLAEASIERTDLVVAIGGGILGDVAGLASALHRRGVRVVQCPTTLLAMVDASVGGKTAVNLLVNVDGAPVLLKNAVGAFHQPSLVVADVNALTSLDARQLRCGMAECIKHAVIAGGMGEGLLSLEALSAALPRLLAGEADALASLVRQNAALKAGVVAADEREQASGATAGRRALNLGHTFAHAIEGCQGTRILVNGVDDHPQHGEAVGLGLIASAGLAEALGVGTPTLSASVQAAVSAAGLPTRLSTGPGVAALIAAMRHDKKATGGHLSVVLPSVTGARMWDDPDENHLSAAWNSVV